MPRLVNHSDDDSIVALDDIEHCIREFAKQRAANLTMHGREHQWMLNDIDECLFEGVSETFWQ